jgi:HAE1 family hydrophobic/amphiphilic exporter-1
MNIIRLAIDRPIAVIAAVLMVVMFGWVALQTIPIQLTPDVNRPVISVTTLWAGAAPAEIEREITNRQEEVLKGITGLSSIDSRSEQGRSSITLEFDVGTNMDRSLLLVSNRLDRVSGYPDEADEPSLRTAGSEDQAIAWFILTRQEGNTRPIHEYGDFVEDVIQDRIERVAGIGEVTVYGGSEREVQVVVEPASLARYSLTVGDVTVALQRGNSAISAGDVDEGKRRYVVRTEGELNTIEAIREVVLRSVRDETTGRMARVTVGDIAEVSFAHKEPVSNIRMLGEQALAFNAKRETGANVIEIMAGINEAVDDLNAAAIPDAGLRLRQVYDETIYINSSVDLVQQNIWVGGTLAAIILILFLRSVRATTIISLAIPVSVVGSFVAMAALGRSINVISLAGLAFAVGMVVDAAIVVLENIYRLRQSGMPVHRAAYEGARQVWGAILVSALTTVMVFIPILVMKLEVGQLFRDIAVAISVSVLLSLVVSVTVLPALASRMLSSARNQSEDQPLKRFKIPGLDHLAGGFVALILGYTKRVIHNRVLAFLVVVSVSTSAIAGAWYFLPKLEYLPDGNRNLMFGIVIPPPGYNLGTMTDIARTVEDTTRPLWASVSGREDDPELGPKIERIFFVVSRASTFIGAAAVDPLRADELREILRQPVLEEPGTFAIVNQLSLFGRGIGGGRKIELDVSGPDLETILGVAGHATGLIFAALPPQDGHQFRPLPGLELGAPEVRVTPDRSRLADAGVTTRELGLAIDAFNDGLRVAEITVGNDRLDLVLMGPRADIEETQGIGSLPVVTSNGQILPASSLATIELTSGPTEIRHRERARTITLEVVPSAAIALESALEVINEQVIAALREQGLPTGVSLRISGTADKLTETWEAMVRDLLIAIVIVYLVMAVLFESFIYPLIILLSVPLAAAGGVAGLALLNASGTFQPLDMLTMLGFVILVGIVVNNAILLIHQTLLHIREDGMESSLAIVEATRNRIRPIFMSTLTSVFGMLPLVALPGAGSELYRGLGSVVVGGLALSALLTLIIVPPMMAMVVQPLEERARARKSLGVGGQEAPAE